MKKHVKLLLFFIGIFIITLIGISATYLIVTSSIKLDENKLVSHDRAITYLDKNQEVIDNESVGKIITDSDYIPQITKNAFISIEDKRFYTHNGIDYKGLFRALINNVKSMSFKEGGSTISQQLIKNTHLSREKTLKRKLLEIKLTSELEKKYTKDQILEKYLNTIYFGNNCYGITEASRFYFDKEPYNLNVNESAMLAGIIKAPSNYSPYKNYDKCNERKNVVLSKMLEQGYISKDEYNENVNLDIQVLNNNKNEKFTYFNLLKEEVDNIIENTPYKYLSLIVETTYDPNLQSILQNNLALDQTNANKSGVIIGENNEICAYFSTCGRTYRQVGSTIKPICVYAPAVEKDILLPMTKLLDEKTDFNGYTPTNYNDKYYGEISARDALARSSNVCAVKVLNYSGIKDAISYAKKLNLNVTDEDENLSFALGATKSGIDFISLANSYTIFNQNGSISDYNLIKRITTSDGLKIYENKKNNRKVYSEDTISLMNIMMRKAVTDGTAKGLSTLPIDLYSKTGTVGNKNGNTDAYNLSYTKDYVVGIWLGNYNGSYLPNNVTGGNHPTLISRDIWNEIYKNKAPEKIKLNKIVEVAIDKLSYDNDNLIFLADEVAPKRFVTKEYFKENLIPKIRSTIFSHPKIQKPFLSVNNNDISIRLCQTEFYSYLIYRIVDNREELIFNGKIENNNKTFIDKYYKANKLVSYKIIPYYQIDNKKYFGDPIFSEKIKSPNVTLGDWWIE